ncbi:MAG: dUTP diphosphatase [Roseibium sp.]|uniref:dUTP diphosphatase n=1 Tax=Roseibium sp. TaxID=1936156 RepID=UPI003299B0DC
MKLEILTDDPSIDIPAYETAGSAGADLRAFLPANGPEEVVIPPMGRAIINTGLRFAIPAGYEIQLRPRSGLAAKKGVTVLNSPGTIDSDFRGPVGIILCNLGDEDFIVRDKDRVAQMVLAPVVQADFHQVKSLSETARGEGGFGSTGAA